MHENKPQIETCARCQVTGGTNIRVHGNAYCHAHLAEITRIRRRSARDARVKKSVTWQETPQKEPRRTDDRTLPLSVNARLDAIEAEFGALTRKLGAYLHDAEAVTAETIDTRFEAAEKRLHEHVVTLLNDTSEERRDANTLLTAVSDEVRALRKLVSLLRADANPPRSPARRKGSNR